MNTQEKKSAGGGVLTGAIAGMALGAAAVVLSKQQNRKKIRNKVNQVLEMGEERMNQVSDTVDDLKSQGRKAVSKQIDKAQRAVEETKAK